MADEAALFKVLADPTRLRLAVLFALHGETCVCVLAEALGESDFKISRHLTVMRAAGMVEARRQGTWMHYKLALPRNRLERSLQKYLRESLTDHETVKADGRRLAKACCAPKGR